MTSEWQPIETAPKDGTPIIAYPHTDGGGVGLAIWSNMTTGQWRSEYDREWPTHWMPLPKPPATEAALSQQAVSEEDAVSTMITDVMFLMAMHRKPSEVCAAAYRALLEKFNITKKD